MYLFPGMLSDIEYKSKLHRKLAESLLLANPLIKTKDELISASGAINKIPKKKIKTLKFEDLHKYGLNIYVG